MRSPRRLVPLVFILAAALACNLPGLASPQAETGDGQPAPSSPVATQAPTRTETPTPTPTPTLPPPTATQTPTPTLTPTPFGCLRPPDDYTRVEVREGIILNQRTLWMLKHAQTLYDGSQDFVKALTQGSYTSAEAASFGTHDGGGAVDLSLRDLNDWHHILYEEFDAIILALRQAGFAAWVRDVGELYSGSPLHIHAIAVGDAELSEAARLQLTGPAGYFRGFNGLPVDPPVPDGWGEPVVCPWMIEMGYADLRTATP
jgi:hypothetical protein